MAQSFAESNNEFALAMHEQFRGQPGNLFFSPFSLRTVLGMAYAGARSETRAQMGRALGFPSSDLTHHREAAELVRRLTTPGGQHAWTTANSLWGQQGAPLLPEYREFLALHYATELHRVDFRRAAEAARQTINAWVDQ